MQAGGVGRGAWEGPVLTAVAFSIAAEIGVVFVCLALVQVRVIGNQVFRWLLREEAVRAQVVAGRLQPAWQPPPHVGATPPSRTEGLRQAYSPLSA